MRPALVLMFGLAVLSSAPLAMADKAKIVTVTPALSPRGDAILVLRSRSVRELPRSLDAADKKTLTRAAVAVRNGKFHAGRSDFARWAKQQNGRLSSDDIILASLWVAREAGIGKQEELANAADRVRFSSERVDALTTTVADLRAAASSHATAITVPVEHEYALLAVGNEKRVEHVAREDLAARIHDVQADYEKAVAESDKARATFEALEQKNRGLIEAMLSMVHVASE